MCKMKGCSRPSFVGGLCGFHALEGYYQARPSRAATPRKSKRARAAATLRDSTREPPAG